MKIAYDTMALGEANGNSVYTTGLIKTLGTLYPDNEYQVFTSWRKKKKNRKAIGTIPAVRIKNILPHSLILGKAVEPAVKKLNAVVLRFTGNKADLYHCTNPHYFTFGIKNPVVTILDLIAFENGNWVPHSSRDFYHKNMARIVSQVKVIFTVSSHSRDDIVRYFPEAQEKIVVSYLGVDDRFQCLPALGRSFLKTFGYPEATPPFLLYAGEIQPRKNIHGLIAAFAALPAAMRKNLHLVIVGNSRKGDYRGNLLSLVEKNKIQDLVHFYANVSHDDLVKFYNAAHAFVFPSFYEGFGIPVVEAMKCGCPVLTSTTSSLPEVGGDAALYVDPSDADALKDKLRQIINDDSLRRTLREKGFAQAAKFTWEKTAELTYNCYRKIVR
jgi:glycosyltransferase involved in cell wall biosynthesis